MRQKHYLVVNLDCYLKDHPWLREAIYRRLEGRELDKEAAYELATLEWGYVGEALLLAAKTLRDSYKGVNVSYSRKVFIPLTNLCSDYCGYCAYRKDPWDPLAKTMTPREVLMMASKGRGAGCTEALFMTGERPESRYEEARRALRRLGYETTIEYLRDMCELVIKKTGILPHSNPGTMTKKEMADLREVNASMGLMLENVSPRLCESGGPHERAPSKHPKVRLAVIESAGQLMIPFTTGVLVGIGETPEELVDSLYAIKELNDRYGHIQEVIIQNFRAKPGTPMERHPEPTLEYMLRAISLARLILGGSNIQAPPNLSRYYPRYLDAGINDWGGISPITLDYVNPESPWPHVEVLREVCEARGYRLRHRLPVYPEYVLHKKEFIPEGLRGLVELLVGGDGYVRGEITS